MANDHPYGYWFKCIGCGEPIGIFPDAIPELGIEAGTAGHAKPGRFANVPNTVPCKLYREHTAEELANMHVGLTEINPPTEMRFAGDD